MREKPLFGVAGYPKNFLENKDGPNREKIFKWLNISGLNVLELEWSSVKTMSKPRAQKYKKLSIINNITLTLKSPYINFSTKENKLSNVVNVAKDLGISKIIIPLDSSANNMKELLSQYKNQGITFYLEPSYKVQDLSVEDILELIKGEEHLNICFNIANIHIKNGLTWTSSEQIIKFLNKVSKTNPEVLNDSYFKVYPISYNQKKEIEIKKFGELKTGQLSFFDSYLEYYPKASDFIEAIIKLDLKPIVVSKTYESEEIGAMILRDNYFFKTSKNKI